MHKYILYKSTNMHVINIHKIQHVAEIMKTLEDLLARVQVKDQNLQNPDTKKLSIKNLFKIFHLLKTYLIFFFIGTYLIYLIYKQT